MFFSLMGMFMRDSQGVQLIVAMSMSIMIVCVTMLMGVRVGFGVRMAVLVVVGMLV